jgi:hypothetical protein
MSDHEQSDRSAALPVIFESMMHNQAWDYFEEQWPSSRIAPDIHALRGTYSQPQDARLFEVSSAVFRPVQPAMEGAAKPPAKAPPPIHIARAPAGRFISFLERLLTRPAFESVIAPFIAQEQHEYYEALLRNEPWYARWIVVRIYLSIGYNVIAAAAASVISLVRLAG